MPNNIYLMVGRSGSGKDTVVDYLCKHYNYKRIISYTTRPPRNAEDKHIFVSDTEFDELQGIVAYTEYNGYRYCATAEQVEEADLYIIDPAGVEYFKQAYKGSKGVKVIGLRCSPFRAFRRMLKRGDGFFKALKRAIKDLYIFRPFHFWDICNGTASARNDLQSLGFYIARYISHTEIYEYLTDE